MKEYIAYRGGRYVIEWFYSKKGRSQSLEYYQSLSPSDRRKVLRLFQLMGEAGQIRNKTMFRNGDKIYAFKPQPHRFLCFFVNGQKIVVTSGFIKKQQKLPKSEKDRAMRLKDDYQHRVQKAIYYEED